jgi:hypothetical protein
MSDAIPDPTEARPDDAEAHKGVRYRRLRDWVTGQAATEWACRERDKLAGLLDRVEQIRREIGALQAEQMRLIADFVDGRQQLDQLLGIPIGPSTQAAMQAEIALAAGVSATAAGSLAEDAWLLARQNPATLGALAAGDLQPWAARNIAAATAGIAEEDRRLLADAIIAEEAVQVVPGKVRGLAQRRVAEVDPDAAARNAEAERNEQHVVTFPGAADGTAYLQAYLEVEKATACHEALRSEARSRKAAGDTRRSGQIMCDLLFERLTGASTITDVTTQISVLLSDRTLLGLDNQPGHLIGHGLLPADIARALATHPNAWLRRFLTDPIDGTMMVADTKRRRYQGPQRDLGTIRDHYCRGIKCAQPISIWDHIDPYADGGPTSLPNGQGLSGGCSASRDHPLMNVHRDPDTGVITWTTPTGRTWRSLPPPAQGHGSSTPDQVSLRSYLINPPPSKVEQHLIRTIVTGPRDALVHSPAPVEWHQHNERPPP